MSRCTYLELRQSFPLVRFSLMWPKMLHLLLVNHCALVIDGVKSILDSKVSSPVANSNRELATLLLEKLSEEGLITCLKEFGVELISQLTCFTALQQEAIKWADYHWYQCAPFLCEMWITFISKITGRNPHPTFYQHVTHHILKQTNILYCHHEN